MRSPCKECSRRGICGLYASFVELNPEECNRFKPANQDNQESKNCSDEKI